MARKDSLILKSERHRFLVTTDSDEGIEGVLFDWDESHIVLADASSVARTGDRLHVDGNVWVPRSRIKYMQQINQ